MKFRKKPVVIEAVRFHRGNFDEIERFVGGDAEFRNGQLVVATLEGAMLANDGDWIIKGVKGEFYPCKPDIFAATYDAVTDPIDDINDRINKEDAQAELNRRERIRTSQFGD